MSTTFAMIQDSYLSRYSGGTLALYSLDLRIWTIWCTSQRLDPLTIRRHHIEQFGHYIQKETGNSPRSAERRMRVVAACYRLAAADEVIPHDPTPMIRYPKWQKPQDIPWLTPKEMGKLLNTAERTGTAHHALVALMGMLGYRVSEACSARIEDLKEDPLGYRTLTVKRKGGKTTTAPIPVPLLRILERAIGDRTSGPIIRTRAGNPQTRNGAYAWIKILCR